jgi:hypothetical protein
MQTLLMVRMWVVRVVVSVFGLVIVAVAVAN